MKASLRRWCEENSEPRTYPKEPKINRGRIVKLKKLLPRIEIISQPREDIGIDHCKDLTIKPKTLRYKATPRIQILAEPSPRNKYVDPRFDPSQNWYFIMMISNKAKNYVASERTKRMAQPTSPRNKYKPCEEKGVKPSALKHQASARTKKLAEPTRKRKKYKPTKPRYVKKSALNATASARTSALAKPNVRPDRQCRKKPFEVRKSALKYTASARMSELSKPNAVTPKFKPESEVHKEWMEKREAEAEEKRKANEEKRKERERKEQKRQEREERRWQQWRERQRRQKEREEE